MAARSAFRRAALRCAGTPAGAAPVRTAAARVPAAAAPAASRAMSSFGKGGPHDTVDENWEKAKIPNSDTNRRAFTYFVLGSARFMYASAIRLAAIRLVSTMSASADVLALSSIEVDLSKIQLGSTITVKWRGKPVFIRRRTPAEISEAEAVNVSSLVDKQTDAVRVQKPEWLVVLGVCTHLGCVPISNAGDYNGWFCPCHGSHYDTSGRIRKGPAPLNLEVPTYTFLEDGSTLRVG